MLIEVRPVVGSLLCDAAYEVEAGTSLRANTRPLSWHFMGRIGFGLRGCEGCGPQQSLPNWLSMARASSTVIADRPVVWPRAARTRFQRRVARSLLVVWSRHWVASAMVTASSGSVHCCGVGSSVAVVSGWGSGSYRGSCYGGVSSSVTVTVAEPAEGDAV